MGISTFSQQTVNTGLANPAGSGNVIINGAFDIWQRGTSFTGTTAGLYTADRWEVRNGTTPTTRTVSRQSFSPGDIESPGIGDAEFYIRNACTGSTSYLRINQRIEDVRKLAGSSVTLSFWARANGGANLQAFLIQNFGAGGSSDVATNVLDVSAPSSWERFTVTVNLPSMAGKTIGTSSYLLLILQLSTVTNGNLDIWGVQLEAGSVATPFKRNANSLQGELAACQRYYVRWTGQSATSVGAGLSTSATEGYASIQYPVQMRVKPTSVDFSSLVFSDNATYDRAVSSIGIELAGPLSINIGVNFASGASTYRPGMLKISGSGFLGLSAEL